MGYYVNTTGNDFIIPKENFEAAYKAMCDINQYDELKRGGGGGEKWFSWMRPNYPEVCKTIFDILDELGFDYWTDDTTGDITGVSYDNKMGNEDIFFCAIAPFVKEGSYINWNGEDHEQWQWLFTKGRMYFVPAVLTYDVEQASEVVAVDYSTGEDNTLIRTERNVNEIIFGGVAPSV